MRRNSMKRGSRSVLCLGEGDLETRSLYERLVLTEARELALVDNALHPLAHAGAELWVGSGRKTGPHEYTWYCHLTPPPPRYFVVSAERRRNALLDNNPRRLGPSAVRCWGTARA